MKIKKDTFLIFGIATGIVLGGIIGPALGVGFAHFVGWLIGVAAVTDAKILCAILGAMVGIIGGGVCGSFISEDVYDAMIQRQKRLAQPPKYIHD
jgi:hypothetical protein